MNPGKVGAWLQTIGGALGGGVVTDLLHHAGFEPLTLLIGLSAVFFFVVGNKLQQVKA